MMTADCVWGAENKADDEKVVEEKLLLVDYVHVGSVRKIAAS